MDDPKLVSLGEDSELSFPEGRAPLSTPLWVAGSLDGLAAPAVAIVGTRAPSDAGRRIAFALARELARAGVCVVSGLALGIDGAAHAGALDGGGLTIGVLGGGHRHFFPRSNLALARKMIAAGGGVTSPYPPEREVFPGQFLERNAIVAGLTDAVVVVEAAARSGALNTASHAANLGISVLAFPGDVDRPKVAGCLALIRDGATLVRGADDVLEAIGRRALRAPSRTPQLDAESRRVVAALAGGEVPFDRLVEQLALEPGGLAAILMELELRGLIEARAGAHYALANG